LDEKNHELWLRRQAVQIAAQLPESGQDALQVLTYAREVVEKFLAPEREQKDGLVMPFPAKNSR
jgi:hypothetical protein